MENLKISDNGSGGAQSSSPADHERHSKQQKHKKSNSSSLKTSGDDWGFERMKKALSTLRKNLSQTGATCIQNRKPRTQAKGMPEEKKNVLEEELQINKDIIKQFQEDLETLITRVHDAHAAQAAAKAELFQLQTTMTQHIAEAVAFLRGETARQKELFKEKISALEKELVHMDWLRQQVILLEEKRQKSTSNIQQSKSIKVGATPVASEVEYYDLIQENETLKFHLEVLREERDEMRNSNAGGKKRATKISRNVEEPSSSEDESSLAANDYDEVFERKNKKKGLQIRLGSNYALVSDRRYFEIDWKKEFESLGRDKARCKSCPSYWARTTSVKDHVWNKHYGGKFFCALCPDSNKDYLWKNSLRRHIVKRHTSVRNLRNK